MTVMRKKCKYFYIVLAVLVLYVTGLIRSNTRLTYLEYTTVNDKNDMIIILNESGHELKQEFIMPYDIFDSISVQIGTFQRDNNSVWSFSLQDSSGKVLYEDTFNASRIVDNAYYRHKIDKKLSVTRGEKYYFSITAKKVSDISSLAYYVSAENNAGEATLKYNGDIIDNTLCFKVYGGNRDYWWHGLTTFIFLYLIVIVWRFYIAEKKGNRIREEKVLQGMILGAVVFLLIFSFAINGSFTDENDNIRGGMVIANGGVLYKDYVVQHTPVMYYLCAIFAALGAGSIEQFRLSYYVFVSIIWMILYIRHKNFWGAQKMAVLPILETVCILSIIPMGHQILSDGFQGMMFTALMLEFLRYSKDCHLNWDRSIIISICIWGSFGAAFVSAFALVFLTLIFIGLEIAYWAENKCGIRDIIARYYKLFIAMIVPFISAVIYFKANNALRIAFDQFYTFNREVYPQYAKMGDKIIQPFINGMQNFFDIIASNFNAIIVGTATNEIILQLVLMVLAVVIVVRLLEKRQFAIGLSLGLMTVFSATRGYGFHGLAAWYLVILIIVLHTDLLEVVTKKIGKPVLCVFAIILASPYFIALGNNLLYEQPSVSEIESRVVDMTEQDECKDIFIDAYSCDSIYLFYKDRKPVNTAVYMLPWYMDWYEMDNVSTLVDLRPRVVVYNEDRQTWGIGHYTQVFDNELMMYYTRLSDHGWGYNVWIRIE